MTLLSNFGQDLQGLLDYHNDHCVSIYLPTYKGGTKTQQNPIRFKNLLQNVSDDLSDHGFDNRAIETFLKPAQELLNNWESEFWRHQDQGLAVFLHDNFFKTYRLPLNFEEFAIVSHRFYVKPLMPLLTLNENFYLLALSQNQVRLFEANRTEIKEVDLDDIPSSLVEALRFDVPEKQLQFHSSSNRGSQPVYHGHGVGTTDNKNAILRYFQAIDNGLLSLLPIDKNIPLVLSGVDYLIPMYRQASSYPNLLEDAIIGNPDNLLPQQLHEQAWEIIEKKLHKEQEELFEDYQEKHGTGQSSDNLSTILAAAYGGQIDTLLVAKHQQQWGQFNPENYQLERHSQKTVNSDELLDVAATQTIKNGGEVHLIDADRLPTNSPVAAIFRYPVVSGKTEVIHNGSKS